MTLLPTALIAMPVGVGGAVLLCLLLDRLVFSFYRRQRANSVTYLIVSIGVMFVIGGITRFIIGPNDRNFNDGERFILKARAFKEMTAFLRGLPLNHHKQLQ